jgi:hypothetical protein
MDRGLVCRMVPLIPADRACHCTLEEWVFNPEANESETAESHCESGYARGSYSDGCASRPEARLSQTGQSPKLANPASGPAKTKRALFLRTAHLNGHRFRRVNHHIVSYLQLSNFLTSSGTVTVRVFPPGPIRVNSRFSRSIFSTVAVICMVAVRCAAGLCPSGARVIVSRPVALGRLVGLAHRYGG